MYKGEINVGQEQLPLLLQAAETLQVRKHHIVLSYCAVTRQGPGEHPARFVSENEFLDVDGIGQSVSFAGSKAYYSCVLLSTRDFDAGLVHAVVLKRLNIITFSQRDRSRY